MEMPAAAVPYGAASSNGHTRSPAAARRTAASRAWQRPSRDNRRMDIQFNGQPLAIAVGTTVTALLAAQNLGARRVAVGKASLVHPGGGASGKR